MNAAASAEPMVEITARMLEEYRLHDPETYNNALFLKGTGNLVIVARLKGAQTCKA